MTATKTKGIKWKMPTNSREAQRLLAQLFGQDLTYRPSMQDMVRLTNESPSYNTVWRWVHGSYKQDMEDHVWRGFIELMKRRGYLLPENERRGK